MIATATRTLSDEFWNGVKPRLQRAAALRDQAKKIWMEVAASAIKGQPQQYHNYLLGDLRSRCDRAGIVVPYPARTLKELAQTFLDSGEDSERALESWSNIHAKAPRAGSASKEEKTPVISWSSMWRDMPLDLSGLIKAANAKQRSIQNLNGTKATVIQETEARIRQAEELLRSLREVKRAARGT